jgi:glycogen operon protein
MRVCLSRFRLSRAQPNVTLGHLASRIAGSSDLYEHSGRRPHASINFVSLSLSRSLARLALIWCVYLAQLTAHDGFTLMDLVSYDHKHNHANLEDNRDGHDDNRSWNHGHEVRWSTSCIDSINSRCRSLFCTR